MSRFVKLLAAAVCAGGLLAASPQAALAQHHGHGGGHWRSGGHWSGGGHWRGGGWGFSPGFALGFGLGYGAPYYYGGPYYAPYYYGGDCGWVRQRYRWHGRWHVRRVWRCW